MKKRVTIEQIKCKRCGKPICTVSRSIFGLDALKARLGNICSECTTECEKQEMLDAMANKILEKAK